MDHREAAFLIVEDDIATARVLERLLSHHGATRSVHDAAAARRALSHPAPRWLGFVFDVELGDGDGLELLGEARELYPEVPALVVTGALCAERVNSAARLKAHFLAKPFTTDSLTHFLGEVFRAAPASLGDSLTSRWDLTPREGEIMKAAMAGEAAECVRGRLGISLNTYKTHVRGVLQKSGHARLADLVSAVVKGRVAKW